MGLQRLAGLIIAGGEAMRLGGQKPLLPFGQGSLLDAVIARVRPQVAALALNVRPAEAELYRKRYGMELLYDPFEPSVGPLGGIMAGLEWLETMPAFSWLATFPCDTPFLPEDLAAQLLACSGSGVPVMARSAGRAQGLCALWPAGSSPRLHAGIADGTLRRMTDALEALDGRFCDIACNEDAFLNVNTPEDLARAKLLAEGNGP
jgi:molybdopterin-guanine dinucleotide biosynthesis protein A